MGKLDFWGIVYLLPPIKENKAEWQKRMIPIEFAFKKLYLTKVPIFLNTVLYITPGF